MSSRRGIAPHGVWHTPCNARLRRSASVFRKAHETPPRTRTEEVPVSQQRKSPTSLSRRKFLASTALAAGAVSWSSLTIISRAEAAETLRVLAWPGCDEKPVVGEFEETNKVKVEFKNYIGGEQMLQFFAQSPKGTFDAIISDAEYVQKFVAQNALVPLNKADFKNLQYFHPK